MKQTDRAQNEMKVINSMEFFLDVCADAHTITASDYHTLTLELESYGITADITLELYEVTISDNNTYLWKTAIITDLSDPIELKLGDIISLNVKELTAARTSSLWDKLFHATTINFDETLIKMVN